MAHFLIQKKICEWGRNGAPPVLGTGDSVFDSRDSHQSINGNLENKDLEGTVNPLVPKGPSWDRYPGFPPEKNFKYHIIGGG